MNIIETALISKAKQLSEYVIRDASKWKETRVKLLPVGVDIGILRSSANSRLFALHTIIELGTKGGAVSPSCLAELNSLKGKVEQSIGCTVDRSEERS